MLYIFLIINFTRISEKKIGGNEKHILQLMRLVSKGVVFFKTKSAMTSIVITVFWENILLRSCFIYIVKKKTRKEKYVFFKKFS